MVEELSLNHDTVFKSVFQTSVEAVDMYGLILNCMPICRFAYIYYSFYPVCMFVFLLCQSVFLPVVANKDVQKLKATSARVVSMV